MQTIRITTSQNIDIDYEMGGLGERIVAALIDWGMFFVIYIGLAIAGVTLNMVDALGIVMVITFAALYVFYDLICEVFMNGQSVGKKVMKIRVVSADGAQPRLSQYLLRWLFRIVECGISLGSIALVVAAISEKGQRIGDMVAGTVMIRTVPRTNLKHVAFRPPADGYAPVFTNAGQLSEQDIELITEVINTYIKTGNNVVVFNMALRIKQHLNITPPAEMNDMRFLQTILKDYSYQVTQDETV